MPLLAPALAVLLPSLAGAAATIAALAFTLGYGPQLLAAIQETQLSNPLHRWRALATVLDILRHVLTPPLAWSTLQSYNLEPVRVQAQVEGDLGLAISSQFADVLLPSFADAAEAQRYLTLVLDGFAMGAVSAVDVGRVQDWVDSETARISLGVTPQGAREHPLLLITLSSLPTFATEAEAYAFLVAMQEVRVAGQLTDAGYTLVAAHVGNEIDRLQERQAAVAAAVAIVTPAVPVAVPTPAVVPVPLPLPTPSPAFPAEASAALAAVAGQLSAIAATGRVSEQDLAGIRASLDRISTAVARPFPGQLEIPDVAIAVRGLTGVIAGVGVGALGGTLVSSIVQASGPAGHNAQLARYQCQSSFAGPLMASIGAILPQLLVGTGLLFNTPLRSFLTAPLELFMTTQLDPARYTRPETEDQARGNAIQRLLEALRFGVQAQLLSYSLEGATPLKMMGFNQLAGFLGDLAGFKRIADGLNGTVETASIFTPLRYYANQRFRPALPSEGAVGTLLAKRRLDLATYTEVLEKQGLPAPFVDALAADVYRELGLGDLSDLLRLADVDDGELDRRLQLAQVAPDDLALVRDLVKLAAVARERLLRLNAVTLLYRHGLIDDGRARAEIEAARRPGPVVEYRMAALGLVREYEVKVDQLQLIVSAFGRRLLSESEALAGLGEIGMDPDRAGLVLLRQRLALVPRSAGAPVGAPEEAPTSEEVPVS